MDDFIKYLFVTDQLDEVFWGKKKEEQEQEDRTLKRTLTKKEEQKDCEQNKRSSSK